MSDTTHTYFNELATWATSRLKGDEVLTAWLSGENSDFVRFNQGLVRQAGSVRQRHLTIDLIAGDRHVEGSVGLAQEPAIDRARVSTMLDSLREQLRLVPADPYLSYATEVVSTELTEPGSAPDPKAVIDEVQAAATDRDLVGIYASGNVFNGFANSLGQRNWYEASTFNLDWSFYLRDDKAVKNGYAGRNWDSAAFNAKAESAASQLEALARPEIDLKPDGYRVYLTPTAMTEFFTLMAWDAFGVRSHRTKQTPLLRMVTEGVELSPTVTITEDNASGLVPDFQAQGFTRPSAIPLITGGAYSDTLVSPRSALEYGVETNGADMYEEAESITMAAGELPTAKVLETLGTGLYIGNLWYLNYSDRSACRTTGMTRFATFWVEGGEIVAPAKVLRFDDTLYNLLGDNLVGLTDEAETMLDPDTYHRRSSSSFRLPGAVVDDMRFTL